MHILITAVDSHEKHGLDGIAIRRSTEKAAAKEMLERVPLLAEWDMIVLSIVCVGGPLDPDEDGELLTKTTFYGPDRGRNLRDDLLHRINPKSWV
jgi:putative AlgH/UPF0301 family transcriptional regulator